MISRTLSTIAIAVVWLWPALRAGDEATVTRRYDLRRITASVPNRPSPPIWFGEVLFRSGDEWKERRGGDTVVLNESEAQVPNPLINSERVRDMLELHLLRHSLVEPDISDRMELAPGVLTVSAPPSVQEEVGRFLRYLESFARRWINVECLAVPPELLDALAPAWRISGPVLPVDAFDRALLDSRARLFTTMVRAGQRVFTGTKEIRPLLCDQEVNQTGVSPVSNPVVEDRGGGDLIEVQALIAPDGKTIVLEILAMAASVRAEKTHIGEDWGDLELPIADGTRILTAVAVSPAETVVLAGIEGRGKRVVLVRATYATPARAEPPAPGAGDDVLRIYDVSTILRKPRATDGPKMKFGNPEERAGFDFAQEEEEEEGVDHQTLYDAVRRSLGEDLFDEGRLSLEYGNGCLFFEGPKAFHEKIEAFLSAEARARIGVVSVDIEFLDVAREVLGSLAGETERGLILKPDWRKVLESVEGVSRRRYRIAGLPGETHSVEDATVHSLVVDSEQVSGGTGWTLTTVSDPVVGTCGEGVELSVRVDLLAEPGEVLFKLNGVEADDLEIRPAMARYVAPQGAGGGVDAEHPAPAGPGRGEVHQIKEMRLQLPRQTAREWNLSLDVPVDRDLLIEVRAEEGERAQLLVGRVHVARTAGSP